MKSILPGEFVLERGQWRDYLALKHFHYRRGNPANWADIWRIVHRTRESNRLAAVGVLSWPTRDCAPRHAVFDIKHKSLAQRIRFANRHIRNISRVIVHPQFRTLGLASRLVRCLCENCTTRYVEASAVMAHVHPFFEKAGMKRFDPPDPSRPVYFIFDRGKRCWPQRSQRSRRGR